jgi:hypothetical protein
MRALRLCAVALIIVSVSAMATPAQARVPAGDVGPAAPAPKAAAPTGPALIRIDVASATVTPAAANSSVLTLTAAPAVSWMGEATTADGKSRLAVGHLSAKDLRGRWANLKLARQDSARATLTWNSTSDTPGFALVVLQRPRIDAAGHLAFPIDSAETLPAELTDVTLNIDRAGTAKKVRASKFPEYDTYQLTSTIKINTTVQSNYVAVFTIVSNGLNCYSMTLIQASPRESLPAGLNCGGVVFTNGVVTLNLPSPSTIGSLLFTTTMTPAGSAPFNFSSVVASWPLNG